MASFRLLVLAFVRDYVNCHGASPSYGEIAAGLDASKTRVKKAVLSLERSGLILRTPGARGLSLPSGRDAAIRELTALGFVVYPPGHDTARDGPLGSNRPLLPEPELDYP